MSAICDAESESFRLEPIRVEVNFAMPLVGRKGERLSRGFGIGVGIEFL